MKNLKDSSPAAQNDKGKVAKQPLLLSIMIPLCHNIFAALAARIMKNYKI